MAAGNVSETIYMAESLYLRFDIPTIMPAVIEALKAKNFDISNINTTHVFFTVRTESPAPYTSVRRLREGRATRRHLFVPAYKRTISMQASDAEAPRAWGLKI